MRVLITNNTLAHRAGSELYVRDLALALLRRGHQPMVFSTVLGPVAEALRSFTIPVVERLGDLSVAPDIIHGQHHLDAMAALLRFPRVPAILVCHGWLPWEEAPVVFPSILRYVAVDDLCRERLLTAGGIPEDRILTIRNFVDLARFQRRAPLPERPRTALVFSNYARLDGTFEVIQQACEASGITRVDVVGGSAGCPAMAPEEILGTYDVVFAKARCALEAMATGCAVVVADYDGIGGMVTTRNMAALRALNFGVRTLQQARTSRETVMAALRDYHAEDAAQVSDWIRQEADMERAVDAWVALYETLTTPESRSRLEQDPGLAEACSVYASEYLCAMARKLKHAHAHLQLGASLSDVQRAGVELDGATRDARSQIHQATGDLKARADRAKTVLAELQNAIREGRGCLREIQKRSLQEMQKREQPSPLRRLERWFRHWRKRQA